MPVHVEEMSADVTLSEGELPMSDSQLEKLVEIVMQRIEQAKLDQQHGDESSEIRNSATPMDNQYI